MNNLKAAASKSHTDESTEDYGGKLCMKCKRLLTLDEEALHKKLYNRAADKFFCMDCSAEYIGVKRELLEKKIKQFKEMGCTLFSFK